jgi:hypothetical protein
MQPRSNRTEPVSPEPKIPGSASTRKNREPQPMPAVEDDEDLDAGFIQTGYRVPQGATAAKTKAGSAIGKSSPLNGKSPPGAGKSKPAPGKVTPSTGESKSSKDSGKIAKAPAKQKTQTRKEMQNEE